MTIKNVREIPTTYRAVQWTGEEADEIRELLEDTAAYSYVSNESPDYSYIHLYDKKGHGTDRYLHKYDWVVVSSKGKIKILDDDEYTEKYEENPKTI